MIKVIPISYPRLRIINRPTCLLMLLLCAPGLAVSQAQDHLVLDEQQAAMVNGEVLTMDEFNYALSAGMANKFYHGTVPEAELEQFQQTTIDQMVEEMLIAQAASNRGLRADPAAVELEVERYVEKNKHKQGWEAAQQRVVGVVKKSFTRKQLVEEMRNKLKAEIVVTEQGLRDYYRENLEKFTLPARDHLWVILLKVQPWEPREVWQAVQERAAAIRAQITAGSTFEEMAELHSQDPSAEVGGDLGIQHLGMLTDVAQEALEKIAIGEVTMPVRVLEGYGLFRRTAHFPPEVRELDEVRDRANVFVERDMHEKSWQAFIKDLREKSEIQLNAQHFPGAS